MAEFAYDLEKTQAWVRAHWRELLLMARSGAGGGAIGFMENFEQLVEELAAKMTPEDAALFRQAVAEEGETLTRLHAEDTPALYARIGLSEQTMQEIDRKRRARKGLDEQGGCAVLIGALLAGAGLVGGLLF